MVFIFLQEPDFTEHRIVVREGEGQKKNGWFSRLKKSSLGSPSPTASRPPSAASFRSSRKQTSDAKIPDEDLPPRIEKDGSPLNADGHPPSAVEPNEEAGPSEAKLPKHAGFDLSAMKAMIQNAERNPADLKVQEPGQ